MQLFEKERSLFLLFSLSVLSTLIGGCLWGEGEEEGNESKRVAGIFIFFEGIACFVIFLIVFIYKKVKSKKRMKKEFEALMETQTEFTMNQAFQMDPWRVQMHAIYLKPHLYAERIMRRSQHNWIDWFCLMIVDSTMPISLTICPTDMFTFFIILLVIFSLKFNKTI